MSAAPEVARQLGLPTRGVGAVLDLLGQGNTVPFVARYRKEATGGLDEVAIRRVAELHAALEELERRRAAILHTLGEREQLTPELEARLRSATTRAELEDLYAPFKQKRKTRADAARERGLEPLAQRVLAQPPSGDPAAEAARHVDPARGVEDAAAALAGARDIVAEVLAARPDVRAAIRRAFLTDGLLTARAAKKGQAAGTKFAEYDGYREPVRRVASHRYLAVERGRREGVLRSKVEVEAEPLLERLRRAAGLRRGSPFAAQLEAAVDEAYKRLLAPAGEAAARTDLDARAQAEAVEVFASNLRDLLLGAPFGPRPVLGLDPGLRTGCKCAAVDAAGAVRETATIYLVRGDAERRQAGETLAALVRRHAPAAVAVGDGTGGRDTASFARDVLRDAGLAGIPVVTVSEAGASVYSASELAREELPDLDVSLRGAVSIARRLQDPLAELVKIEPRSIGVGQYQHDVDQALLRRRLGEVIEDCVNAVGVDLNTASPALLAHVAGLGPKLAGAIVERRHTRGPFRSRRELLDVPRLGPRAFEQAAGFLRVPGGGHPLDASAVHPERYDLVTRMAEDLGVSLEALVGDPALVRRIDLGRYAGDGVGEATLRDILAELEKPGRDPRASFEPPRFREDVRTPEDLEPEMELEGVVTNVTAFGAFVDVGVKQDGLVHVSELADRYVEDPRDVVKLGDRLTVRVLSVDLERRRIALTARKERGPKRR